MKKCKQCGEMKPLGAFYTNPGGRDGRRPECKECNRASRREWYQANREKVIARVVTWQRENRERYNARMRAYRRANADRERARHLKRTFALSTEDYEALLREQGGGCAICGREPGKVSLHVDHDHETGEIRGLLCFRCNGGLGQFKEKPERLLRATEYVTGDALPLPQEQALARRARERARRLRVAS